MADPRIARTRAHVLAVARKMLVVPGADPLTWTSLSQEAQVSRRTLYTHWESVEQLLTDLVLTSSDIPAANGEDTVEERLRSFLLGVRTRATDRVSFVVMVTTALAEQSKEIPSPEAAVFTIVNSWVTSFQQTVAPLSQEQYFMVAGPIVFQSLFALEPTSDEAIEELVGIGLELIRTLPAPVS